MVYAFVPTLSEYVIHDADSIRTIIGLAQNQPPFGAEPRPTANLASHGFVEPVHVCITGDPYITLTIHLIPQEKAVCRPVLELVAKAPRGTNRGSLQISGIWPGGGGVAGIPYAGNYGAEHMARACMGMRRPANR